MNWWCVASTCSLNSEKEFKIKIKIKEKKKGNLN